MSRQQWEYKIVWIANDAEEALDQLSNEGNQGWELVAVTTIVFYFKRPVMLATG